MTPRMGSCLLVCLIAGVGMRNQGQSVPGAPARDIDAILAAVYKPGGPGAAAIVVKDGRILLRKAYGLADVELEVPMRPEMVFPLASITKQFTATAILKLAEQGRLSVSDEITRFLPGYPTRGARITIEHLLTHTSGISSLTDLVDLRAASSQDARVTDLITDWVKDQPLDFAPGERWAYLNWGYSLLGAIVEQASGQGYAEFLRQQIFDPLGMVHTSYADNRRVVPLGVPGYELRDGRLLKPPPGRGRVLHPGGASALLSTIDDLALWNEALCSEKVLGRASLERMFTPYRLKNGRSTLYGYGWSLGQYEGRPVEEHAGGAPGFLAHVLRMPEDHVYVAILSNMYSFNVPPQTLAHRIAALAAGRPLPTPVAIVPAPGSLGALAGTYRVDPHTSYTVTGEGNRLFVQLTGMDRMEIRPVAPLEFVAENVSWTFVFEKDRTGRVVGLHVRDWSLDDLGERVPERRTGPPVAVSIAPKLLDCYAGDYELITGPIVTVSREGDHLVVQVTGQRKLAVLPSSPTEFFAEGTGPSYTFLTDRPGNVTGLVQHQSGWDLPARRFR
jgi:CubicO group peptidase (beta-lactamase class C family)